MRCIWEGNLRNVLDNIKLCVIIENLHFWAMNHLRPWLSGCIDQWKRSIDEFEAENNRSKPENSSEKQPQKPNQSKARVPTFGANQSKPRSPLFGQKTASNYLKMRNPFVPIDPNPSKARSSFGGRIVPKSRSKQLDSHGRSNFALRRANTLESCLDQDEGLANSDNTSESSEEEEEDDDEDEDEDGEEEESEEDQDDDSDENQDDDDDEYEPGSEEEEDEEREENIDIAIEQLKISLRNDKRGKKALDALLGYWWQHEE
jgi:hypothetical protein